MLRPLLLGTCLAVALTGCAAITTPHNRTEKAVNTALTGACLAAQLAPCTIEPSEADKKKATEAKATAVRASAQRDSTAADQDAARRSSCLTDTGPRLPVSSSECATYGKTYSSNDLRMTGRENGGAAPATLDPTAGHDTLDGAARPD
jgi:hypothetical protein